MGWINSIQRPRSLVAVLITLFALAACGNGSQDLAAPATEPRRVDPSVEEFLDDTLPDDKRAISVHHLLTHTSGLTDQLGGDYETLSREEMLEGALESELRSAPGTEYSYSNLGYSILATIVEEASGTSYERFLARNLFEPAGMRHTGYVLPTWKPDQVAVEYDEQRRLAMVAASLVSRGGHRLPRSRSFNL